MHGHDAFLWYNVGDWGRFGLAVPSAPYESRYDPNYVAWGADGSRLKKPVVPRVQPIRGSGFGCVVMRAGLLKENQIQIAPRGRWYDPSFFDLLPRNVVRLIDWTCEAEHIGPRFFGKSGQS